MSPFQSFSRNTTGRDFIVGDIHGAFGTLFKALKAMNFNRRTDRIFCSGDLIDRGKDSHRAIRFLKLPFVHSIMGNHEHEFLNCSIFELRKYARTNYNGMGWISGLSDDQIIDFKLQFRKLPIAIEIETAQGLVGLVHADVPKDMTWARFKEQVKKADSQTIQTALIGRNRIKSKDLSGIPGIERVYVGHTIFFKGPKEFGNVTAIDCGAVFAESTKPRGALAVANLESFTTTLTPDIGRNRFGTDFFISASQKISSFLKSEPSIA